MTTDAELARWWEERLLRAFMDQMCGPQPRPRTLAYRGGRFVSLEIDDTGKVIEPLPRCPRCGPVLACSQHMVTT